MTATTTEKSKASKNGTSPAAQDKSSRFTKLATEQHMYVPEEGGAPLIGYLLYLRDMPPDAEGRDWQTFVVRTTEPTKVRTIDDDVVEVPPGSEVLIGATAKLKETLGHRIHPDLIYEVYIKPGKKVSIGRGRTMWQFEVGVDTKTVKPRPRIYALNSAAPARAALPQKGDTTEMGAGLTDEDLPF